MNTPGNRVKCKYCKESYASEGTLVKHFEKCKYKADNKIKAERLTNTESVVCQFCTVKFPTKSKNKFIHNFFTMILTCTFLETTVNEFPNILKYNKLYFFTAKAQRSTYSRHKYRCRLRTSRYKGRVFVCDYCNKKLETAGEKFNPLIQKHNFFN